MKTNLKTFGLALLATLLFSLSATAQWTYNATSIFPSSLHINKNVGFGTTTPHAPIQLANYPLQNRKIVLFEDANNDNSFFGFGINPAALRYQVGNNSSHIFYASNNTGTASMELFRIKSTGQVGIGTPNPNTKLHINGTGIDNDGVTAVVRIVSGNGAQHLLLDGNEIDALADGLYLNNNTNQNLVLVNGGGKVGIGTTDLNASYRLRVNGTAFATGSWTSSDRRYKNNIQTLGNALEKVLALRGAEYTFRTEEFKDMNFDSGKQIGFIAQEMKEVLPELVMEDATGYHAVNYQGVIPVLVEAIKEQQTQIQEKDANIAALKIQVNALEARLSKMEQLLTQEPSIESNKTAFIAMGKKTEGFSVFPNPNKGSFKIRFQPVVYEKSAVVIVLDLNGKEINRQNVRNGESQVDINLHGEPAGAYVYQLLVDGKMAASDKILIVD